MLTLPGVLKKSFFYLTAVPPLVTPAAGNPNLLQPTASPNSDCEQTNNIYQMQSKSCTINTHLISHPPTKPEPDSDTAHDTFH